MVSANDTVQSVKAQTDGNDETDMANVCFLFDESITEASFSIRGEKFPLSNKHKIWCGSFPRKLLNDKPYHMTVLGKKKKKSFFFGDSHQDCHELVDISYLRRITCNVDIVVCDPPAPFRDSALYHYTEKVEAMLEYIVGLLLHGESYLSFSLLESFIKKEEIDNSYKITKMIDKWAPTFLDMHKDNEKVVWLLLVLTEFFNCKQIYPNHQVFKEFHKANLPKFIVSVISGYVKKYTKICLARKNDISFFPLVKPFGYIINGLIGKPLDVSPTLFLEGFRKELESLLLEEEEQITEYAFLFARLAPSMNELFTVLKMFKIDNYSKYAPAVAEKFELAQNMCDVEELWQVTKKYNLENVSRFCVLEKFKNKTFTTEELIAKGRLLEDELLFDDETRYVELLELLKLENFRNSFHTFIPSILSLISDTNLKTLLSEFIDTAYIGQVLQLLSSLEKKDELVKYLMDSFLKKQNYIDTIHLLSPIEKDFESLLFIYFDSLAKYLENYLPKQINDISSSFDVLYSKKCNIFKHSHVVLNIILDAMKETKYFSILDIEDIFKSLPFWEKLTFIPLIDFKSQYFQQFKGIMENYYNDLIKGEMKVKEVLSLEGRLEKLKKLFINYVDFFIEEKVKVLFKEINQNRNILNCMKVVISSCSSFEDGNQLQNITALSKAFDDTALKFLQDKQFWGSLSSLYDISSEMVKYMNSKSFRKYLSKYLNDIITNIPKLSTELSSILELYLGDLKKLWDNDITILDIDNLFLDIPNQDIEEEFVKIDEFSEKKFWDKRKQDILYYLEKKRLQNDSKYLVEFFKLFESKGKAKSCADTFVLFVDNDFNNILLRDFNENAKLLYSFIKGTNLSVIEALSHNGEILDFVKETMNEDMRILINGVEEHSDSFIRESTVSDFIDVWSFIRQLYYNKDNDEKLLEKLRSLCNVATFKNIEAKIQVCGEHVHGLRRMHKNLSNRTEITKEIVAQILKGGSITTKTEFEQFQISVQVDSSSYGFEELQELKSRSLLLSHSSKTDNLVNSEITTYTLEEFVSLVDNIQEMLRVVNELFILGYPVSLNNSFSISYIKDEIDKLEKELNMWKLAKKTCCEEFPVLQYYHSQQFWTIEEVLIKVFKKQCVDESLRNNCLNLIKLIAPHTKDLGESLEKFNCKTTEKCVKDRLYQMGKFLSGIEDKVMYSDINDFLQHGVAIIPIDVNRLIPMIISVFYYCGQLPDQTNIVVCTSQTSWDELNSLLQRSCRFSRLYCIANMQNLNFTIQDQLIAHIKSMEKEGNLFKLALLTDKIDVFSNQFKGCIKEIKEIDKHLVSELLHKKRKQVEFVYGHTNGVGKSEYIKERAYNFGKNTIYFPIGGNINQKKIVNRLINLTVRPYSALHLDISIVTDPQQLNVLLFELIVIGKLSYNSNIFLLSDIPIFVEVANTINNTLFNTLNLSNYFKTTNLTFSYSDLIISSEELSAVQIVCNYLNVLDIDKIDSTDIIFRGPKKNCIIVERERCIALIRQHLFSDETRIKSYSLLNVYLQVLANQLVMMSESSYFRVENLELVGAKKSTRKTLIKSLLSLTTEFSANVNTLNKIHHLSNNIEAMAEMFDGFLHWEDSNHLLILFHSQDCQTISAVYRDPSKVPEDIVDFLKSQNYQLQDYRTMPTPKLRELLNRISRTTLDESTFVDEDYALTADNFLKMLLIISRVRAKIPVILLGETGCGKTSLINYIAKIVDVSLKTKDIHAGITEEDIVKFVLEANNNATEEETWIFLDEINTCDSVGLINELLCNRTCLGIPLKPNVIILAACNPYRYKLNQNKVVAGLEKKIKSDSLSRLAYRVNPLPQSLIDYIWDYGTLLPQDERFYIRTLVENTTTNQVNKQLLEELLFESQQFIRNFEDKSGVSMRDIARFKKLFVWFMKGLLERKNQKQKKFSNKKLESYYTEISKDKNLPIRAIILALSHCYHSRLVTDLQRQEYRKVICNILNKFKIHFNEEIFLKYLRSEQMDYVLRMELPDGIALNTALLENIFVILVCILNKIPIFVVGKPGCSKSLSMQLINSNLRGLDSKDLLFRTFPQVYVVAYQGSESSTSEGIEKVFKKAEKYLKHNLDNQVIPVVLLDEVGLAEVSKHNPLKVLHKLLEPEKQEIAVVGISNWCLDASKMNRAIHLSRPDTTIKDLTETGISILKSYYKDKSIKHCKKKHQNWLTHIAESYYKYHLNQEPKNFHGLRDYYNLIKYLVRSGYDGDNEKKELLKRGIERNFGGLPRNGIKLDLLGDVSTIPVLNLIESNLEDTQARHLMLITNGDSTLGITESIKNKKSTVIYGSSFEEDQSEEYNYRTLSKIILCMESDTLLVLRDLENIYGSLYDMLNQSYTVVGKKKNCRIALGPYSNPMCYVNDNFRCIILVDNNKVNYSDPPFLNRFEKQRIGFVDLFSPGHTELLEPLQTWIQEITSIEGTDFNIRDAIRCFTPETLESLVIKCFCNEKNFVDTILDCKEKLIELFSYDSIIRLQMTGYGKRNPTEVVNLVKHYHSLPHSNLRKYVESVMGKKQSQSVVVSFSNLYLDILSCFPEDYEHKIQKEKLGYFKSEKQVQTRIESFFSSDTKTMLFIQCDAFYDAPHLLLLKTSINNVLEQHKQSMVDKHIFIVLHTQRNIFDGEQWLFNFLGNWNYVMIDNLEENKYMRNIPTNESTLDLIKDSFVEIYEKSIPWCFLTIRYTLNSKEIIEYITSIQQKIKESTFIRELFLEIILKYLSEEDVDWKKNVLCNRKRITLSSSIQSAIFNYLCEITRSIFAKYIYLIEKNSAFDVLFDALEKNDEKITNLWRDIVMDPKIIDISGIVEPETDVYSYSVHIDNLSFPFSRQLKYCYDDLHKIYEKLVAVENEPPLQDIVTKMISTSNSHFKTFSIALKDDTLLEYCVDDIILLLSIDLGIEEKIFKQLLQMYLLELDINIEDLSHPIIIFVIIWKYGGDFITVSNILKVLDEESYEDFISVEKIIDCYSVSLYPTSLVLDKYDNNGWYERANLFISYCNELNIDNPESLLLLKIFCDFFRICSVSIPDKLQKIATVQVENTMIDTYLALEIIASIPSIVDKKIRNRFIGTMLIRCSCLKNCRDIILSVLKKSLEIDILMYCEFDIIELLIDEDILSIFQNPNRVESVDILKLFNDRLKKETMNNELSTFVSDLFSQYSDSFDVDDRIVPYLLQNLEKINDNFPVLTPIAVGIMKSLIDRLTEEEVELIDDDSNLSIIKQTIIDQLNIYSIEGNCPMRSLVIYLLKKLSNKYGNIHNLKSNWKQLLLDYPFLSKLQFNSDNSNTFKTKFLFLTKYYLEVMDAYELMVHIRKGEAFSKILEKSKHDSGFMSSLLAVIIEHIYFSHLGNQTAEVQYAIQWLNNFFNQKSHKTTVDFILLAFINNGFDTQSPFYLSVNTSNETLEMVYTIVHYLVFIISFRDLQLSQLLHLPLQSNNLYIPSMPDSHYETIKFSITEGEAVSRYLCEHCSYMFFVGNCGGLNQSYPCPSCKNPIGGGTNSKRIDAGTSKGEKEFNVYTEVGYIHQNFNNLNSTYSCRKLSPQSFRILSLFVHSMILLQKSIPKLNEYTIAKDLDILLVREIIESNWYNLSNNLDNIPIIMNCLILEIPNTKIFFSYTLNTSEERQQFENEFNKVWESVVNNKELIIAKRLKELDEIQKTQSHFSLEKHIMEIVELNNSIGNQLLSNPFRVLSLKNFNTFETAFYQKLENSENFPIIDYVLQHREELTLLSKLPGLIKCSNTFLRYFNYKLIRKESKEESVYKFIENNESLQTSFEEIRQIWKEIGMKINRQGCTPLKVIPELSKNTKLLFFLLDSVDESRYLLGALEYLSNIQNNLLEFACGLSISKKLCLHFLEVGGENCTKIPIVKLQQAISKNIINFEENDNILIGYNNLQYGKGKELVLDYQTIELLLIQKLIFGKKYIDIKNIETIQYKDDLFSGSVNIISGVQNLIKQEILEINERKNVEKFLKDTQGVQDIMFHFEYILWMLSKVGTNPEETIQEFCKQWNISTPSNIYSSFVTNIAKYKLKYSVSLFEIVEYDVCSKIVEDLTFYYREKDLSSEDIQQLQKLFQPPLNDFPVFQILQKLISRFLISDKINRTNPINYYLCNRENWPVELLIYENISAFRFIEDDPQELIPTTISFEYTYSLYHYLFNIYQTTLKKQERLDSSQTKDKQIKQNRKATVNNKSTKKDRNKF